MPTRSPRSCAATSTPAPAPPTAATGPTSTCTSTPATCATNPPLAHARPPSQHRRSHRHRRTRDRHSRAATAEPDTGTHDLGTPDPEPAADNIDWADVLHRAHTAWLSWTGPISISAARRIACDCTLTPIVLDDNDAPLNLRRTTRTVSRRLRRAVLARDGGCAFPQCGRPAEWCQAHHLVHWIDGGPTDLDNLVLLCTFHHRLIHHSDWEDVMGTDRHPWFIPPTDIDPTRTPIPANGRASPRAG